MVDAPRPLLFTEHIGEDEPVFVRWLTSLTVPELEQVRDRIIDDLARGACPRVICSARGHLPRQGDGFLCLRLLRRYFIAIYELERQKRNRAPYDLKISTLSALCRGTRSR